MRSRLILFLLFFSACGTGPKADWVLRNGAIYTLDSKERWAQSLAVGGGTILYVGDDAGVEAFVGPESRVIELGGKMVLPGFIDSHSHPSGALIQAVAVSLYDLRSLEQYLEAVRRFAEENPDKQAVRGSGWSNALFPVTGPMKEDLDAVVSDRPVQLGSGDGHSSWVNSKALELAGITRDTPDPEGGVIERDPSTGEATGTLRESATGLVAAVLPPFTMEERMAGLLAFQEMAAKDGVTTARVAAIGLSAAGDLDPSEVVAYERLESEGKLRVRFRGSLLLPPDAPVERIRELVAERERQKEGLFEIDAVKIFVDGVVEGETAYLLEPYLHRPDYRGELLWNPDHLKEMVAAADREGFIVHIHAIGDAATGLALDAFQFAREKNGPRDARHQVTHLQLVTPSDVKRFASLAIIAVPQPFWFSKGGFYDAIEAPYLGEERASREYPMKSFFDAGVTVASASDFPVTIPFSPVVGMKMGITRSFDPANPEMVLGPEERVSLDQMIASFTRNGAFAARLEDRLGSLEVGKVGDVVVLDRNLFEVPTDQVGEAKVLLTLFEGREIYRAPGL
ncbi:MAG TPA: amidohydrolase [Vicinamibacteria bacterium]|nr:amidohydrolase [Vicinamibacteria bacterium]